MVCLFNYNKKYKRFCIKQYLILYCFLVIDFCLIRQLVTDPQTNFQCLELKWASKVNCEQRAGRTGRVMDGRVYRLVPRAFYEVISINNLKVI